MKKILLLMTLFSFTATADHAWHSWMLFEYEYVYNANDQQVMRCVYECRTTYNDPHYATVLGGPTGCPVP